MNITTLQLPFTINEALIALGYSFAIVYITWIFYLAVMNLARARDNGTLSKVAYVFGLPVLYVGLFFDALVTIFVGTILFLDLPRELTLTGRLQRLSKKPDTWRGKLAIWICRNLLDTFDPSGDHC